MISHTRPSAQLVEGLRISRRTARELLTDPRYAGLREVYESERRRRGAGRVRVGVVVVR